MNKTEIVADVALRMNVSKASAGQMVEAVLRTIADSLAKTNRVRVTGFGTFAVVDKPARQSRNPRTGETVDVPAKRVVKFKPEASAFAV